MPAEAPRSTRRAEVLGFVAFAFGFMLLISLATFTPKDPAPFFKAGESGPARNFIGPAGAFLAELLIPQLFGVAALLLPLVLALVGWKLFWCRPIDAPYTKVAGILAMLASLTALLSLTFGTVAIDGESVRAGGATGELLALALTSDLNRAGAYIVVSTALFVSLILTTQFSFAAFLGSAGRKLGERWRALRTAWAHFLETRRKERMRREVIRKHTQKEPGLDTLPRMRKVKGAEPEEVEDDPLDLPLSLPPRQKPLPFAFDPSPAREDGEEDEGSDEPEPRSAPSPVVPRRAAAKRALSLPEVRGSFTLPPTSLLNEPKPIEESDTARLYEKGRVLQAKCGEFGVLGTVKEIHPGPVVTTYEFKPDAGVKYSKIVGLADDLALALEAESIRIERVSGKPERRYIRRTDLDPVSGGHPVYLVHVSGHAGTLNSEGLRLSGITRTTEAPPGGEIEHGPDGLPTGVLKDTAMELAKVERKPFGPAERLLTAERVGRESAEVGLTTIHNSILPLEDAETYQKADALGRLKVRVIAIPFVPNQGTDAALARLGSLGVKTGDRKGHVTWGAVKFMCDGGMAAKTIAVTPPGAMDDPKNLGRLGWETAKLTAAMKAVHAMGWQITAHGIGDRAIAQILDSLEAALGESPGDHRSRIVHCGVTTPALLDRIKRMGVLVDHNPPFVYWIGDWFRNYGEERVAMSYRGKTYEDRGILVSGGSDVGVTPLSPWWGIWSAVERKEYRTGEVLAPAERVDVRTALKWYTAGGAYAGFEEKDKSLLGPGRLADFIVLDRDLLTVPSAELKDVKVLATFLGGEMVHGAPGLGAPPGREPAR